MFPEGSLCFELGAELERWFSLLKPCLTADSLTNHNFKACEWLLA